MKHNTEVCKFATVPCKRKNCSFAHSIYDIKLQFMPRTYKTQICKSGVECKYNKRCLFLRTLFCFVVFAFWFFTFVFVCVDPTEVWFQISDDEFHLIDFSQKFVFVEVALSPNRVQLLTSISFLAYNGYNLYFKPKLFIPIITNNSKTLKKHIQ